MYSRDNKICKDHKLKKQKQQSPEAVSNNNVIFVIFVLLFKDNLSFNVLMKMRNYACTIRNIYKIMKLYQNSVIVVSLNWKI
jgi:hypothetical protein